MKNENLEDKAKNEDESKRQPQIYWWPKKMKTTPLMKMTLKMKAAPKMKTTLKIKLAPKKKTIHKKKT